MKPFIIENIGNASYINSLLFGLFFNTTNIDNLLNHDLDNSFKIYLQEYINNNFVNKIRNNKSILSENIEGIRQLCFYNGWLKGSIKNYNDYLEQYYVSDFYSFLMNLLLNEKIKIRKQINIHSFLTKKIIEEEIQLDFIELEPIQDTSVKELFYDWCQTKSENGNENDIDFSSELTTKYIINTPDLLTFHINRWDNDGKIVSPYEINIQKKMKLNSNLVIDDRQWVFHSAICFSGSHIKDGHYYTIFSYYDKYYIFDDNKVPCITIINEPKSDIIEKLKRECLLVIYKI